MIEAIQPLSAMAEVSAAALAATPASGAPGFLDAVRGGAVELNDSLQAADGATRALAAGQDIPLHEVMITLEQARLDMQFTVQVRNRVLAAYHDIISMQV